LVTIDPKSAGKSVPNSLVTNAPKSAGNPFPIS
jgi:hypothetical protein